MNDSAKLLMAVSRSAYRSVLFGQSGVCHTVLKTPLCRNADPVLRQNSQLDLFMYLFIYVNIVGTWGSVAVKALRY
jgi:hypothetical protein